MIRTRILKEKDWREYRKIGLETLLVERQAFNSKFEDYSKYEDDYWKKRLLNKDDIYVVGEEGNEMLGVANLRLKDEEAEEGMAFVQGMYVKKEARGKGLGKRLLSELVDQARGRGIKKVRLWVRKSQLVAIKMYESEGFEYIDEAGERTLIYEKKL